MTIIIDILNLVMIMLDYKAIGRRISTYRKKNGLTQAVLSEKLGISESYISQIERGVTTASLARLDKIADALKIDIALLLSTNVISSELIINSEICEIVSNWSNDKINFLINLLICADEQFKKSEK